MGRAKYSYSNRLVNAYIDEINRCKKEMYKNFNDMDLCNASVQRDMYVVVDEMMKKCDNLISKLDSYYFE